MNELCSTTSQVLGEALAGTASTVKSWLLLERPGAWPRTALDSRHIPRDVAVALSRAANAARVRVVTIRRPGRPAPDHDGEVACYLAHASRVDPWIVRAELPSLTSVLDPAWVDLAGVAAGVRPGEPWRGAGPVFCVCTHGRHDPCCAVRGRPVAAAMAAEFPEETWEVSHIGGDRFAANVVCFPHGLYLGRVEPMEAAAVARTYAAGGIPLANYRGRACDATSVQAADAFLRAELGLTAITATRALTRTRDDGVDTVRFAVSADAATAGTADSGSGALERVVTVRIRGVASEVARTVTCHGTRLTTPTEFVLLDSTDAGRP